LGEGFRVGILGFERAWGDRVLEFRVLECWGYSLGFMVSWFHGFVVLWFYGFMILWLHGFRILGLGLGQGSGLGLGLGLREKSREDHIDGNREVPSAGDQG
jgi:hypothetical protein